MSAAGSDYVKLQTLCAQKEALTQQLEEKRPVGSISTNWPNKLPRKPDIPGPSVAVATERGPVSFYNYKMNKVPVFRPQGKPARAIVMSLHNTVSGNRVHIGFFGRRNAGKSSLVNAVTGQNLAVVSAVPGTTTDPVQKAMELLPMGPVLIIDTPGIDDEGALGALRVQKTQQVLHKTDVAVLVVDASVGKSDTDEELIALFREQGIPFLVAYNKCDLLCRPPRHRKANGPCFSVRSTKPTSTR